MKFEVTLDLDNEDIAAASVDSLVIQLGIVVATAVEEQQIEIPDAEIIDYETTRADDY